MPCTGNSVATATMVLGGRSESCHLAYSDDEADYDVDHSGVINALQWDHDPRVTDANHNGFIDAEDLIVAFSNNVDHDHDGYPNDISGWDFYDGQNDPATVDATYPHSDEQMLNLAFQCPKCLIMPIKADEEALDRGDHLAQAWLFAATSGAKVITSVTADLGYSSFMRQTIQYCWDHGIVMVESSNDFDSTDHQGGMYWPDVVPGNGALQNFTDTGWTRGDETSWGPHNMFSVAGQSSTSGSTSALGGLFGLLMSWGQQAYERHLIPTPLTGPQAIQVMRATSRPITDTTLGWPGAPGDWSSQYGYGIPDLYKAMALVAQDDIPPVATITSPGLVLPRGPDDNRDRSGVRIHQRPGRGKRLVEAPGRPRRATDLVVHHRVGQRTHVVPRVARHARAVVDPRVVLACALRVVRRPGALERRAVHGESSTRCAQQRGGGGQ